MPLLWAFIKALPELLALFRSIQAGIDEMESDRKAKDDVKAIHEAMLSKDPTKLNALFNPPIGGSPEQLPDSTEKH